MPPVRKPLPRKPAPPRVKPAPSPPRVSAAPRPPAPPRAGKPPSAPAKPAKRPPVSPRAPAKPGPRLPTRPPARQVPTVNVTPIAEAASYDNDQTRNQQTVVSLCESNHVPHLGIMAALCAGAGENDWHTDGCNSSDHCGFWQLDSDWQKMHDYHDVVYWTRYAIQHGFYGQGGISHIAKTHPDWSAGQVAQACQGAGPTDAAAAAYYETFIGVAAAVYNRYKGVGKVTPPVDAPTPTPAYVNPLKDANVTAERIDMGVDYAGTGHYSAIAEGVVTRVSQPSSYWPGNMIQYRITQPGFLHGVLVYYAEGIHTNRKRGDTFKAGEWLCELIPGWGSGTELGFAAAEDSDDTWANVYGGGYNEGDLTRGGIAFSRLIAKLGGAHGLWEGRTPKGDWPSWVKGGHLPTNLADVVAAGVGGGGGRKPSESASSAASSYTWPTDQVGEWSALSHGTKAASDTAKNLRDYVNGVAFLKATGKA